MSRRRFVLFFLSVGLLGWATVSFVSWQLPMAYEAGLIWVEQAWAATTRPRRINPNAPPRVDPGCFDRLAARPGVSLQPANTFTVGEACLVEGAVVVDRLAGLSIRPARPVLRCEVAEQLDGWLREAVVPTGADLLDSEIASLGHIGTFNCRTIANSSILSQHSFANAIDIAWVDLADGRRLRLVDGWGHSDPGISEFWQKIHQLSCNYFDVSLGPNYNAAHRDHFHFDMGPFRTCR